MTEGTASKSSPSRGGDDAESEEHDPAAVTSPHEQQLGRYRLCFEIASGGMATVYLARAEGPAGFEKLVALKRIHPHLAKQRSFVEMFLDEARIASRISHPNVCSVFDFGEASGTFYITMEYLVGEPLSRVLRVLGRRPDLRNDPRHCGFAARIVADACEGLHAAHELRDASGTPLDVVHRDVSPHNLFVTYDGSVRIVDFGIARAANRVHETRSGTVKGKYAYMAPEQVRGKNVDRRADVWSLGVVLWELATIRRLFKRDTDSETIFAVASDEIVPPSAIRPGVPPEIDQICMRALSRDRDGRYPTAREMGRDLHRFLSRQPEPVGVADLADWMVGLFPEGLARKRQIVDIARAAIGAIPQLPEESSNSASIVPSDESEVRTVIEATSERRRRRALTGLVVGAGLLVVGAAVLLGTGVIPTPLAAPEPEPIAVRLPPLPALAVPTTPQPTPTSDAVPTPSADPTPTPDPGPGPAPATRATPDTDDVRRPTKIRRPTKRETPPPPEESGTGTLNVVTPGGWAEVWLGSRRLGQTPGSFTVPAGRHTIEVRPFGQSPGRTQRVTVTRDQPARVVIRVSQ